MELQSIGNVAQAAPRFVDQRPDAASAIAPVKPAVAAPIAASAPEPLLPQVVQAVRDINKTLQVLAPNLEFSVDADSQRTIVKVVDQQTQEIIRQMPSTEALEIAKALDRVQGLLIRHKV